MPSITNSKLITSAAQVGTGVIGSDEIANGAIVNEDVNASAAIAGSKLQELSVGANAGVIPSTGIVNNHVAAGAAIVDTKLATISTAGKVDGAALTGFTNIPSGAGNIPLANLGNATSKIYHLYTDVVVSNPGNGVETTIFSATLTANTLGANGALVGRIWITAEAWTTAGTNSYKLKLGATTIATATIAGGTEAKGFIDFAIQNTGATNTQEGYIVNGNYLAGLAVGTAAIDTTQNATLAVTMTPSASNPGDSITFGGVIVTKSV